MPVNQQQFSFPFVQKDITQLMSQSRCLFQLQISLNIHLLIKLCLERAQATARPRFLLAGQF